MAKLKTIALLLSCIVGALAQSDVLSDCDPKKQSNCPSNQAQQQFVSKTDFTGGEQPGWRKLQQGADKISYDKTNGAVLTIAKQGDSPTFQSKDYIFYGKAEVVMKAAPGVGIVSSLFLTSDCLDEIDFEFLGKDHTQIQSNYFRGGNTTLYDRGGFHAVNGVDEFHKYTLEYTPAGMTFSIDDNVVRSIAANGIKPVTMGSPSPQTPTFVRIGMWASGDPNNEKGVIEWGGGLTDYSRPYSMYIKSITMTNYSPAQSYKYKSQGSVAACNQDNVAIEGGELMSKGDGAAAPPPPAGGSSSSAAAAPTQTGQKDVSTTSAAQRPVDTLVPPPSTPQLTTTAANTTAKPPPSPSASPSKKVSSSAATAVEVARGLGLAALLVGGSFLMF